MCPLLSDTITENYNQSKCEVMDPSPNVASTIQLLHLRVREHCGRGDGKSVIVRGAGVCYDSGSPTNFRGVTIKSREHDYLDCKFFKGTEPVISYFRCPTQSPPYNRLSRNVY